jgi:cell division septation protein DedD
MSLERDIHRLLYTHDCVVVPGFGGFLAHYRPARLDVQRQMVHPPAKDISFNRHLQRTDGLLAQEVMKRDQVDHLSATRAVEEHIARWQDRIQRDGRLELDRIGTFFRDAEQNLQFTPDKRVNLLKHAYGLRPVAAIPVLVMRPVMGPKVVPIAPPPAVAAEVERPERYRTWWTAAAAIAIFSTLGTWWLVGGDLRSTGTWEELSLFMGKEPRQYHPVAQATFVPVSVEDTAPWRSPDDTFGVRMHPIAGSKGPLVAVDHGPAPVEEHANQSPVKANDTPAPVTLKYHIIGGCFQEKENADRFASELQAKGFAAKVLDRKNGLYRVSYGSYAARAMAVEALNAVRKEEAPQAWLLVR